MTASGMLVLSFAVLLVAGPGLAWLRVLPAMAGFIVFVVGGIGSLALMIASIVRAARRRALGAGGAVAIATGLAFAALVARSAGSPRINDFTTDLANPPSFEHAATLPANAGRDLRYPASFADVQRRCCSDLRPAQVPVGIALAFARARDTAIAMGWTVTEAQYTVGRIPAIATGRIEAIATSRLFGFQDDIAVRVVGVSPGMSRVDIRSKSRHGRGDVGANAARIREYVATLEQIPGLEPAARRVPPP